MRRWGNKIEDLERKDIVVEKNSIQGLKGKVKESSQTKQKRKRTKKMREKKKRPRETFHEV